MTQRIPVFMSIGAIGFLLQMGSLALLTMAVDWPYEPATAIAVQLAVVHNFLWHERWTWRDRTGSRAGLLTRFARYEITTGATSIAGGLLCTALFVEALGLPLLAANAAAVVAMSVANYLVSDRWVFTRRAIVVAAALAPGSTSPATAAELKPETVSEWNKHIAETEARFIRRRAGDPRGGQPQGDAIGVPGGRIHHWRGSTLIHGITVEDLVRTLMNRGTPPPQADVLESRVLGRSNDSLRVYLKVVRRTIMTVTYDTEHQVTFRHQGPGLATSRSVSTKIAEVDGRDRGFLWRLNSYWRYIQVGSDVLVELESVSLSRDVPMPLKPVAGPIVNRIARESMASALDALRVFFENA